MPHLTLPEQVKSRATELKKFWRGRDSVIKDWYGILTMDDDPAIQAPREQYVGNDPRTFYNLSRYLFTTADIKHQLDTTTFTEKQKPSSEGIEDLVRRGWRDNNRRNIRRGRGGWLNEFIGLMLVTGWYSLFVMPFEDRLVAEIWNPAQVYPDFEDSDLGLIDVVRVYQLTIRQARRLALRRGWKVPTLWGHEDTRVNIYNYFSYLDDGTVYNAVVIHNEFVRYAILPQLDGIPVYTGPVGGLPDRGIIQGGLTYGTGGSGHSLEDYTARMGESIFATNRKVYKSQNRSMSHEQQILRDTAQPPILEKKHQQGGKPIVDADKLFTRAHVMRMTTQDSVEVLALPGIPAELRQLIFDINAQRQRGSFPDLSYGNIQSANVTALMINQAAGASQNILQPYLETTISVLEEIDEVWAKGVLENEWTPYRWEKPSFTPPAEDVEFKVDFRIKLPGDLAARATIARILDPEFNLDTEDTIRLLFPEIQDPMLAVAKSRADMALRSPLAQVVTQVAAYEIEAELLRKSNPRLAELYAKAAKKLEAMLDQQGIEQPGGRGTSTNGQTPTRAVEAPIQ